MFVFRNPALEAFVAILGPELVFGQVCIRTADTGYELRHVADRDEAPSNLRPVAVEDLRALAHQPAASWLGLPTRVSWMHRYLLAFRRDLHRVGRFAARSVARHPSGPADRARRGVFCDPRPQRVPNPRRAEAHGPPATV